MLGNHLLLENHFCWKTILVEKYFEWPLDFRDNFHHPLAMDMKLSTSRVNGTHFGSRFAPTFDPSTSPYKF